MNRHLPTAVLVLLAAVLFCGAVAGSRGGKADEAFRLPHRDDFTMNSISGGGFRQYITDHVAGDDTWARSMQTFGTFHNHMHEMMSQLARYDGHELACDSGHDRAPDFDNRISGGEWSTFRKNLEEAGVEGTWRDLVQTTEVMHDRVHDVMYNAVLYDNLSRGRGVDLEPYVEDRAPYTFDETRPDADLLRVPQVDLGEFRHRVWHGDEDSQHLHAALQQMLVFDEMLDHLLGQWARYAESRDGDGDEQWQRLMQTARIMRLDIRHMMHRMSLHVDDPQAGNDGR